MGLSLEGFGGEFEIGKIAFELEDLKKDKEKRREKIGDFAFFKDIQVLGKGGYIYVREEEKKEVSFDGGRRFFLVKGRIGRRMRRGGANKVLLSAYSL